MADKKYDSSRGERKENFLPESNLYNWSPNNRNGTDYIDNDGSSVDPVCPEIDSSLQEENTLSACLMKILQNRDSEEITDIAGEEDAGTSSCSRINKDLEGELSQSSGARPKALQSSSAFQSGSKSGDDIGSESEVEKLRKWREAGVALRKALSEQSSDNLAKTPSCMSSSFCSGTDDPMNIMLDDYMSSGHNPIMGDVGKSTSDRLDDSNAMKSDPPNDAYLKHNKVLANSSKSPSSHGKKPPKYTKKEKENKDISQGLAEVREKIKKITSRISLNNNISTSKTPTSKPPRCTTRSQKLSSKTESSSTSESEDAVVPKRHKFVHKTQRTRSNSRSPKTIITPPSSLKEQTSVDIPVTNSLHKSIVSCSKCGGIVQKVKSDSSYLNSKTDESMNSLSTAIPNISTETFTKSRNKQQDNVKYGENIIEYSPECTSKEVTLGKKAMLINTLSSLHCDSEDEDGDLPDLLSSSGDETIERSLEEALNHMQRQCVADERLQSKGGNNGVSQRFKDDEEQEDEIANKLQNLVNKVHKSKKTRHNLGNCRAYICSCGENKTSGKNRNTETEPNLADIESSVHSGDSAVLESEASRAEDEDTFEYSHGDELDDLADLDLSARSLSECEEDNIELDQEEINDLPGLVVSSSSSDVSGGEADDEFECDCPVCQRHRQLYDDWITDEEPDGRREHLNSIRYHGDIINDQRHQTRDPLAQPFNIDMEELTPLDLIFMQLREGGRQEFLELMFHNVIMQMLSVYPDLLGEQAPPPAPQTLVNNLPTKKIELNKQGEDEATCPICLCTFEDGEEARELPCKHFFHLMCIQLWLNKSGTCPVCRHVLSRISPT